MNFQDRYQYNPQTDYLGGGAFADVFKAYDTLLDRTVALKFYKGTGSQYDVLNEIKTVIKQDLTHPNLIRYYDAAMVEMTDRFERTTQNQVGIIEYANGKEFLKKGGDLNDFMQIIQPDEATFKNIIRDILQGLDYLGRRNIIHRDLKPANILVHKDTEGKWIAKIADFGLSKNLDNSASSSQGFKGTIEYMAPEQLYRKKYAVGEKIQTNADLWAFGIVLYELFAREIPIGRRSEGSTVEDIMENLDLFEPNQLVLQNIPMLYRSMIQVCLIKFPEQRVQTASELLKMLESPRTSVSIPTSEDTLYSIPQKPKQQPIPPKSVPPPKPKQKKKQSWLFLIPFFALIAIFGLWASGIFSPSNTKPNPEIATDSNTTLLETKQKADSIHQLQREKEEIQAQLQREKEANKAQAAKEKEFKNLLAAADTEYQKKNYKKAITKYELALKLKPNNSDAAKGLNKAKQGLEENKIPNKYFGYWVGHHNCLEIIQLDKSHIQPFAKHGGCLSLGKEKYEITNNEIIAKTTAPFRFKILNNNTITLDLWENEKIVFNKVKKGQRTININGYRCQYTGDISISNNSATGVGKAVLSNGNSFEGYFFDDSPMVSYQAFVNGIKYKLISWDEIKNGLIPFEDKNGNKGHFDKNLNIIQ